jgi:hypothetical protein
MFRYPCTRAPGAAELVDGFDMAGEDELTSAP